jgi:NitT/TauT family transport system ATP-binding protein
MNATSIEPRNDGSATRPAPDALALVDVSFAYEGRTDRDGSRPALDRISLTVASGEFVALIGANGTGKSTLLRLASGLLRPDRGTVRIDGRPVDGPDGRVGFVFQEPRLLPWRSTLDNVAFPLELAGWPEDRRRERADELLGLVGLVEVEAVRPFELSGGMRQRAAIARALAMEPGLLLLDEPFSALDALTRERFDLALESGWRRPGMSVVVVTHSIPEAILLADRIVVLAGRPGTVVGELTVPLGRPRSLAALETAESAAIAGRVRALLAADEARSAADEAAVPAAAAGRAR